ncbi:uncharacterized protein LOC129582984 [Paramacrobiotus metropolitanus]|uniref:uncharacterized protein LOC129582984 n=1 Tax=Paramacrobiotus metropolitanus TaxID=2943436 RepID=UPI0024464730|nr:uncharacterized protein LOC129582984 [Paramacrobiotus metropolitanus]
MHRCLMILFCVAASTLEQAHGHGVWNGTVGEQIAGVHGRGTVQRPRNVSAVNFTFRNQTYPKRQLITTTIAPVSTSKKAATSSTPAANTTMRIPVPIMIIDSRVATLNRKRDDDTSLMVTNLIKDKIDN